LFPQKFKTGTVAILPTASRQSEPEKTAEPGTFWPIIHPKKIRSTLALTASDFQPTFLPQLIWKSSVYQASFGGLP
jgi:hypothetical protein